MLQEFETLMNQRWILKSEDKQLYYQVRDQLPEIRRIASEKMGCSVVENSLLVKLEKIPETPQSFMGIQEFGSGEEYAFLCVVLMFLEDRDPGDQFILSQLTEYVEANMPQQSPDWTSYTARRRLIRVLRYVTQQGMLRVTDGSDESFMEGSGGEVLYENTGASRYFMRSFTTDIMAFERPEDFAKSRWIDVNEDRGIARRHRVYNRLLFSPGVYRAEGSEEDFEYLKNYGHRMNEELEKSLDCQLHVHRGCAFLMEGEDSRLGECLPLAGAASDCVLLFAGAVREKVEQGEWKVGSDEMIYVDQTAFEEVLRRIHHLYAAMLPAKYREMTEGEWFTEMRTQLESWTLTGQVAGESTVRITPLAGKICGRYLGEGEESDAVSVRRRKKRGRRR